jgi:hypothetical protein
MNKRALVSTRKGLFELHAKGSAWELGESHFLGEPLSLALFDPRDGAMYAALNLGHFGVKLQRKDKGSDSWTEVAVPAYPVKPDGDKDEVEWKLKLIWSLETGGPDEPGVLWAGTNPGGLFKSSDRGASWELVQSLWDAPERREMFGGGYDAPGIHSICVDPRNSRHILIGISCGGAWRTEDGGATWALSAKGMIANFMPPELADKQQIQDPHRIVRCEGSPDAFWCQHHGGIWRSTDNGMLWTEVSDVPVSNFGFAVAVHPQDPERAWFVPAKADQQRVPVGGAMVVNRTSDGGASFTTMRDGLPQQHCYDLVYRHGLAVSPEGNSLVMGSTTGGLWVSNDAGASWQTVSTTLPPIYAVCFA